MIQALQQFLAHIFGDNAFLATIVIALIPIIEIKGAIPFGMSTSIFGDSALSPIMSYLASLIGSCALVPLLALLYTPIIKCLKQTKLFRKIGERIDNRINKRREKVEKKIRNSSSKKKTLWLKILGVFAFVVLPLPLTGVWTGTALSVALGLNFWITCIVVILANCISGLFITLFSEVLGSTFMLIAVAVIVLLMLVFYVFSKIITKIKRSNAEEFTTLSDDNKE